MPTVQEIAKTIDHSVLQPVFTDEDLRRECGVAVKYGVAAVCVKPYQTRAAAELVRGSGVKVCAVTGFPHGNGSIDAKVFETGGVCRDGAEEVDTVVNIGKVLGEDWSYVENELTAIHNACRAYGAALKVIFETDFITRDEPKIRLCEIVSRLGIAFVKTSTGYGFVKRKDGAYGYTGATEHDLRLMRRHCSPQVQIKAAGGIRTLDRLLQCLAWGASRIGASATESIMEEAKRRFGVPRVGGPD